ncbi:MAG: hypothetical protein PF795_10890, partial [Kiritimatiellae bacterium]|nr:hypothetical protein [Kiritimatiellia bacterium]
MMSSHARSGLLALSLLLARPLWAQSSPPLNSLPFETEFATSEGYAAGPVTSDPHWGFEDGLLPELVENAPDILSLSFTAPGRLVF